MASQISDTKRDTGRPRPKLVSLQLTVYSMARNILSATQVANATLSEGVKMASFNDGDGLVLLVARVQPKPGRPEKGAPRFTKRWRFIYRFGGRQNRLGFGDFPTVALAAAREHAEQARKLLANGVDPAKHRKAARSAPTDVLTFRKLADEWLQSQAGRSRAAVTLAKHRWLLSLVRPSLDAMAVVDIKPMHVLDALKKIEARGRFDTARRCRATLSRAFKLAVSTGRMENDPAAPLAGSDALRPPETKHRPAIVEPKAFGQLLRKIDVADNLAPETKMALQLLTLTALRPGECRQLRYSWLSQDDKGNDRFVIPAAAMKVRKNGDHVVPVSRQAVALIEQLRTFGHAGDYLFPCAQPGRRVYKGDKPSKRPNDRPMSEGALNAALKKRLDVPAHVHVPHGMRSSFSSLMSERSTDVDAIEACLGHVTPGIRGIYMRAEFIERRRVVLQAWADYCDELREGRLDASDNVIALSAGRHG
jgi:integrase